MKLAILIVLAVAVALFASIASANTAQVLIKDFKFQPDQITIQRRHDHLDTSGPGQPYREVRRYGIANPEERGDILKDVRPGRDLPL